MDRFFRAGCLTATLATAVPAPGGALSTTGAVTPVPAPPSVELDEFESNTEIRLFQESTIVLEGDLLVDITLPGTYTDPENVSEGSVSAGTAVTSHLLQFDTIASQLVTGIGGSVTFDTQILGVMVFDVTLDLSDATVGLPSVVYPTGLEFRGTEISTDSFRDAVTLEANLQTLVINRLGVDLVHDQIRVITTAIPEPSTSLLVGLGLFMMSLARNRARATGFRARRPTRGCS